MSLTGYWAGATIVGVLEWRLWLFGKGFWRKGDGIQGWVTGVLEVHTAGVFDRIYCVPDLGQGK
jgi:hypothetical protein